MEVFYSLVTTCEFDILCLTETWLTESVHNSELFPTLYNVYRCDRDLVATGLTTGGGTLLAVKDVHKVTSINTNFIKLSFPYIDIVACKISFLSCYNLIIYVIYIPPTLKLHDFELFFETLETFHRSYINDNVIICGDFNVPGFTSRNIDGKSQIVRNFGAFLNISNYNNITNMNDRLLDLILSEIPLTVTKDDSPLVNIDKHHPPLNFTFEVLAKKLEHTNYNSREIRYNFRCANYLKLYDQILCTNWTFMKNILDVNIACDSLYSVLNEKFASAVPIQRNHSKKYPPWFTSEIIANIKDKDKARSNFKKYHIQIYQKKFQFLRRQVKNQIKISYFAYVQKIEDTVKQDPSKFWSFVNMKKRQSRIPNNMTYRNETLNNYHSIVNGFANFFGSVYLKSNAQNLNITVDNFNLLQRNIAINEITEDDIIMASKKLKNKMTSGVDNCPSFLVKDCINVLATPLCYIFNLILTTETYPEIWKKTKICPILKSGDNNIIENYRPISILCNFGKLFEIIIYNKVYPNLYNLISSHQHGFMSQRSTVTNLMCLTQFMSEVLDTNGQVDIIYTDIQKAFDQIDHFLLLAKLDSFGISDSLIRLLRSYLTKRKQFVEYAGFKSDIYIYLLRGFLKVLTWAHYYFCCL